MTSSTINVLLIEDDDEHSEIIHRRLNHAAQGSLQIERADRLSSGLDRLSRKKFHAVLLDLSLPDSDGIETCRRIVASSPGTPVIVLTALDMDADGLAAVEAHAEDYLPKSRMDGDLMLRALRCATERTARRSAEADLSHSRGELAAARQIQTSLLPNLPPQLRGFDVVGKSIPAEVVGGDCYDWQRLPGGDTLIAIGDASGHGLAAALVMAQATASLRTLAPLFDDVGEIMTRVNRLLSHELPDGRFMTMNLLRINQSDGSLRYCSAGHPGGMIFDSSGQLTERLESNGMPLGMLDDPDFRESPHMQLNPGDTLVLLTDGISECQSLSNEMFGNQQIIDLIARNVHRTPQALVDELFHAINHHRGPLAMNDDMTVVIIRRELTSRSFLVSVESGVSHKVII